MRNRALLTFGPAVLITLALGAGPAAEDPAKLAPDSYKVLLDNERMRVLDVRLPAGGRSPMHSHPPYAVYSFSDGKVRFTSSDGTSTDVELKSGETQWRDAESHAVENIGANEAHVLNIEMKGMSHMAGPTTRPILAAMRHEHVTFKAGEARWQAGPPSLPRGAQMVVLSGDPKAAGPFVMRFKMGDGYRIPPHFHPADENVTVISGTLFMGQGDTFDAPAAKELPAGSFTSMPAGMHHFAFAKGETVLQLHGVGPWRIIYLNPADDPEKAAVR